MTARRAGACILAFIAAVALLAPWITPHDAAQQFGDYAYAPPMPVRVVDASGALRAPFVYPLRLVDRLERRYEEDRSQPAALRWFRDGALVRIDERAGPWLPLGADALGRDVFARLLRGAHLSLGIAVTAALCAVVLGTAVGAAAGYGGRRLETALMTVADLVILLPVMYVVLALRSALPLVMSTSQVFLAVAGVMGLAGWPFAARGVRAIIATERTREYAEAARASGAGSLRILLRHLLPATKSFLAVQLTLLVPAFILAEAALSYAGLGFDERSASWGVMLRDASRGRAFTEAPWLLTPALAIAVTVLAVHLTAIKRRNSEIQPELIT